VRPEGLGKMKKSNDLIENQTRDLPACKTVPLPITLPRAPRLKGVGTINDPFSNIFLIVSYTDQIPVFYMASNMAKRARACIAEQGSHFEHML
jgi:hypothetical protein